MAEKKEQQKVYLPSATRAKLAAAAAYEGVSISAFVAWLIEEYEG